MGFDGLFFGRLDYADKDKRLDTKTMEMMWKGDLRDQCYKHFVEVTNIFLKVRHPRVKNIYDEINYR